MSGIFDIIDQQLEPRATAEIERRHDEALYTFEEVPFRVAGYLELKVIAGEFLNHNRKVTQGQAPMPAPLAGQEARELLEKFYRSRNRSFGEVVDDAKNGTNGGVRSVLRDLSDVLKQHDVHLHRESVIDSIAQEDYDHQLEIVRQLIRRLGHNLPPSIDASRPERYVKNYRGLIYAYLEARRTISSAALS